MAQVRYDRINEEVKKTVSEIVRELKDPRISALTSIMSAEVTNDQKLAKIRVSVYDNDVENALKTTVDALNGASGFIMRELGRRMDLRNIPKIKFFGDDSIEYSIHIADILNKLNKPKDDD